MIQKVIVNQVLKIIDKTFGKKFKIIDDITDLFQGTQDQVNDHEDRITKLERERNEDKSTR